MTPLICIGHLKPGVSAKLFNGEIFPLLSSMASDKISNVRMNVAKVFIEYAPLIKGGIAEDKSVSLLKALSNDIDFDVSHFAKVGLKKLK